MRINKKALTAAITLSLALGVEGLAGATSLYGVGTDSSSGYQYLTASGGAGTASDNAVEAYTVDGTQTYVVASTSSKLAEKSSSFEVKNGTWESAFGRINGQTWQCATSNDNIVKVSGGTFTGGDFADTGVTIQDNKVALMGGAAFTTADILNTGTTSADNNQLSITGGNITGSIFGGYALAQVSGTPEASGNVVTITGGTFNEGVNVYGGYVQAYSDVSTSAASNNTVNIGGYVDASAVTNWTDAGTWSNVSLENVTLYGGYILYDFEGSPSATSTSNTLNIFQPTKVKGIGMAGNSAAPSAIQAQNSFQNMNFYLPESAAAGDTMLAVNSDLDLNGVTINTITPSTLTGRTKITLIEASSISNLDVSKLEVNGENIFLDANIDGMSNVVTTTSGNYSYDDATNMTKLYFTTVDTGTTIGYCLKDSDVTKSVNLPLAINAWGHTLNFKDKLTITGLSNAGNLNFYIPDYACDGYTMLTIAGSTESDVDLSHSNIKVWAKNKPVLHSGDRIILVDNRTNGKIKAVSSWSSEIPVNAFQYYTGIIRLNDDAKQLIFTPDSDAELGQLIKPKNTESAKSPVETQAAGMTMLTAGGDMLVGAGMESAAAAAAAVSNILTPFAVIGGHKTRVNSGSHVDIKSWNINVGLAKELKNSAGKLVFGPVVEYGRGTYDSYVDTSSGTYRGDGKTSFLGLGLVAKQTNLDNFYYEGSLRFGRLSNDYSSAGGYYDDSTAYYALHAGLGKLFQLNSANSIDCYAKLFWTHQNGMNAQLGTAGSLDMEAVNSVRSKLGFRYNHAFNKTNTLYAGLAWQYEFNGTADAALNDVATAAPSLKGHTGFMELGWKNFATKNMELDLGVNGYTGVQHGVGVNAKLNWYF